MRFKVRNPASLQPSNEVWPDALPGSPGHRWIPPFVPRPALRKLRVAIDAELLAQLETPRASESDALLASLLHHSYVSLLRFADGGPPASEIAKGNSRLPGEADGWMIGPSTPPSAQSGHVGGAIFAVDGVAAVVNCSYSGAEVAAQDAISTSYPNLSATEAAMQRSMDVIAAACAYAVGADLFITNRPYLFDASWDAASGVLAVRPLDALPLLGLYLRAQDVFTVRQTYPGGPMGRINMNRGGFYTTATYDLLPSLGRWFGAVEAHSLAVNDDSVAQLAGSVVNRLQQALQDRDRVWVALNRSTLSDAGSDALDALDDVLLRLMGAIDITARVARAVLGLDEELSRSGWTSKAFLKAVRKEHRPLAGLFDAGSPHRLTLNVVSELRNTIHHTALPEIRINEWRGSQQTWVGLREAEEPLVLAAADSLGGRQSWGVNEPTPGRFHLDPGRLADQLIIHTANLIVAVQDTTPVEQLAGVIPGLSVDLTSELDGFGLDTATRVRLQLGLGTDYD